MNKLKQPTSGDHGSPEAPEIKPQTEEPDIKSPQIPSLPPTIPNEPEIPSNPDRRKPDISPEKPAKPDIPKPTPTEPYE